jgi:superfamily I DNA/RNA helicase
LVRPSGKGVFDKLVTTVINGVDSGLVPRGQYGAILVDEGHDFEPDWYGLISKMVDPGTNSLLVLYDDAQNIYGKATRRKFTWRSVGIDAVGHTTILKLNYRNTLELLSVAKAFVESLLHDGDADDEGVPVITPESAGRRGPIPELIRASNRPHESEITIARIRDHLDNGRSPSDIAVITRHERDAEYFYAQMKQGGIPSRIANGTGKSELFHGGPAVKVLTMHSSKGLEFAVVFIPRIGDMPGPANDPTHEARLLYVAMTRATEEATIIHDRESEFTLRLRSAIDGQHVQALLTT